MIIYLQVKRNMQRENVLTCIIQLSIIHYKKCMSYRGKMLGALILKEINCTTSKQASIHYLNNKLTSKCKLIFFWGGGGGEISIILYATIASTR